MHVDSKKDMHVDNTDLLSRAVYTVYTGAGGCQQRQVLLGGYLQQTQVEISCGQNHS